MTSRDDAYCGRRIEQAIRASCRRFAVRADEEFVEGCCAEIPAILRDPQVRFAWLRLWHALSFAVGVVWSARRLRAARAARVTALRADIGLAVLGAVVFTGLQFALAGNRANDRTVPGASRWEFSLRVARLFLVIRVGKVDSASLLSQVRVGLDAALKSNAGP